MGVGEAAAGVEADHERLGRREAVAGGEGPAQRAPGQVLGDQVRDLVDPAVVHHDHVRVADRGHGLGLGPEPLEEVLVAGEGRLEHLDRHLALQGDVLGQEHLRGRPGPERGEESVPAAHHATDLLGQL